MSGNLPTFKQNCILYRIRDYCLRKIGVSKLEKQTQSSPEATFSARLKL